MKILFISHEGTRTGAPYVLYYLIKWIKQHRNDYKIDVLFLSGGDFIESFRSYTDNIFINQKIRLTLWERGIQKLFKLDFYRIKKIRYQNEYKKNNYCLIYANSIASLNYAIELKKILKIRLILHLHELNINLQFLC